MLSSLSIPIDYGSSGINVEVPTNRTTVIRPVYKNGLKNDVKEINRVTKKIFDIFKSLFFFIILS